ncbi:Abi family protein [Lacticaseibacillus paracasei subsp. tolerans]|uniref:Abi family protein n=1 Tax=Lacticaseibacillus paracasei TaxID=1597 RepID=UPI0018929DA0|nr:Abi family protein [Lacticaseibacillus paracasei]QPC21018.1 Abi family protein [Lacticaseibacillus paracasei subsp. tolerans]
MIDKPFKTIDEQLSILHDQRGLSVLNVEAAKKALTRYGYYEIINGYKEPFLNDPSNDDKGFRPDANFEHIFQLFILDKHIRECTLQGIEEFESTFKQAVAYSISKCISPNQQIYTDKAYYNRGKIYHQHDGTPRTIPPFNERDKMLYNFGQLLCSNDQPYKYYREHHGNIPPWIMIKNLMLGQVIYWYKLSKPEIRLDIISRMLSMDSTMIEALDENMKIRQSFGDLLDLVLDYRNLTAHGGRVYNHRAPNHELHSSLFLLRKDILNISKTKHHTGYRKSSIGALILTLGIINNPDPKQTISSWIDVHLAEYLKNFPQDENMLMQAMELEDTRIPKNVHALIENAKSDQ